MSLVKVFAPVFIGALVVVLLAAGALAFRLSRGPIPLTFLTERIERALSELSPDLVADVSGTELAWAGDLPEIRVLDVKIARRSGESIAELPALSVRPSLRAAARGRVAVRRLEVVGVQLSVIRDDQDRLLLTSMTKAGAATETPIDVKSFFATESEGGSATQYLKRIVLRDLHLEFDDRKAGRRLKLDDADGELVRHGMDFEVDLAASVWVADPSLPLRELATRLTAKAEISPTEGGLPGIVASLSAKGGTVLPAGDPGPALPLRTFVADAKLEPSTKTLEVSNLRAGVGAATILEGFVSASPTESGWSLQTQGELRSLPVSDLRRFWPVGAASSARNWVVKNIPEGRVAKCRFSVRLPTQARREPTDPVDVSFDYDDLVVHYFGELDPVRKVAGTGHINTQGFEARVTGGEVGALHLEKGAVDIRFHTTPPRLTTSADLTGPAGELLAQLGKPPLDIPTKIGIDPAQLGGTAGAHVDIEVPLHAGLEGKEVKWTGSANLEEAAIPDLIAGIGIEKGKLALTVDGTRVDVEGDTVITGAAGVTDPAHLVLRFEPGAEASHLKLALKGTDAVAEGIATFAKGSLRAVSVSRLKIGANELSGDVIDRQDGGYHISVGGESLDLEPWVRGDKFGSDLAQRFKTPYDADFHLRKISLGNGVELHDVNGTGAGEGSRVDQMDATGNLPGAGTLVIALGPGRTGVRRLRVTSNPAGPVLKALGIFADAEGGRLTFIARFPEEAEKTQKPTDCVLSVRDFRVTRAPVLAKILSAGSLEGMSDLLQGEGMSFSRARIPFRYQEGRIEVYDASTVGAMGLAAEGTIDRKKKRIDLRGQVFPAYTLNSALGKIPYIGDFLVGGKDQGIFGITYKVTGALDQPDVSVNPLSALAPGALRKLFVDPFSSSDDDESSQKNEDKDKD